jgi:hypothetical protein
LLSQREGFSTRSTRIDQLLEREDVDGRTEARTRLRFFLRSWTPPSATSEEFSGTCLHSGCRSTFRGLRCALR